MIIKLYNNVCLVNILIEKIKEAIVECLREDLEKNPNGLGVMYAILRRKVESRVSDPTFSDEIFCQALTELAAKQKILTFGAIRMGLFTLLLKTD